MSAALVVEFFVTLLKALWAVLVGVVTTLFPSGKKKDVSKEVVLVTGAGSGLGKHLSLEFAKLGATLVLWDINEDGNDAVKSEIKGMGGVAHAFKVDCSKREEIFAAADKVIIPLLSLSPSPFPFYSLTIPFPPLSSSLPSSGA
jgi:all-trans-retinol dehydrogenase (NAD+)